MVCGCGCTGTTVPDFIKLWKESISTLNCAWKEMVLGWKEYENSISDSLFTYADSCYKAMSKHARNSPRQLRLLWNREPSQVCVCGEGGRETLMEHLECCLMKQFPLKIGHVCRTKTAEWLCSPAVPVLGNMKTWTLVLSSSSTAVSLRWSESLYQNILQMYTQETVPIFSTMCTGHHN